MINWGDYTQIPDYRQFLDPNKHKSGLAQLGQKLDPMTHIPGVKDIAIPIHQGAQFLADKVNEVGSPIVKAAHQITDTISPGLKELREQVPALQNIQRFSENKPGDAAAIIMGSIFSGGAAGGLAGGGGSGAGSAVSAAGGSTAGALQGGTFSGLQSAGGGLLSSLKAGYAAAQPYLIGPNIASRLNDFAGPDVEKLGQQAQQNLLAERVRNDQQNPEQAPPNPFGTRRKQQVIDALMQQNYFGRAY